MEVQLNRDPIAQHTSYGIVLTHKYPAHLREHAVPRKTHLLPTLRRPLHQLFLPSHSHSVVSHLISAHLKEILRKEKKDMGERERPLFWLISFFPFSLPFNAPSSKI